MLLAPILCLGKDASMPQKELRQSVLGGDQVLTNVFASANEISDSFLLRIGHPNGGKLPRHGAGGRACPPPAGWVWICFPPGSRNRHWRLPSLHSPRPIPPLTTH